MFFFSFTKTYYDDEDGIDIGGSGDGLLPPPPPPPPPNENSTALNPKKVFKFFFHQFKTFILFMNILIN